MPDTSYQIEAIRVLECAPEGAVLRTGRDATDLIGAARGEKAAMVAIPVARLDPDFFRLKTGVAGEFVQKFVTYGVRLAIVGDISKYLNESPALGDFVSECNKGAGVWFVADRDEFEKKVREHT
jgi:hypothetical protein